MRAGMVAAVLLLSPVAALAETGKLVAVLEFRNQPKQAVGDRLRYSLRLRRDLARAAPGLRVMTREEMQTLARENPDAFDRCNDDDCVEVGRLLGADVVIEGTFTGEGKNLVLTLRVVDTRARKTLGRTRIVRRSARRLLEAVGVAAPEIAASIGAARSVSAR